MLSIIRSGIEETTTSDLLSAVSETYNYIIAGIAGALAASLMSSQVTFEFYIQLASVIFLLLAIEIPFRVLQNGVKEEASDEDSMSARGQWLALGLFYLLAIGIFLYYVVN